MFKTFEVLALLSTIPDHNHIVQYGGKEIENIPNGPVIVVTPLAPTTLTEAPINGELFSSVTVPVILLFYEKEI